MFDDSPLAYFFPRPLRTGRLNLDFAGRLMTLAKRANLGSNACVGTGPATP
jgi:hypothetical protein